jgi:hypothetical protein
MALFFDHKWFDSKLNELGLSRADMAISSGLSEDELKLIFKDQMEVTRYYVQAWAILLRETTGEVAKRCGVSTPVVAPLSDTQKIEMLENRVARLETQIEDLIRQQGAKL